MIFLEVPFDRKSKQKRLKTDRNYNLEIGVLTNGFY